MASSDWQTVNTSTLPEHVQTLYAVAKEGYREYKAMRAAFEDAMQAIFAANLAEGTELKFGYNFGKLSVAVGAKVERKAKAAAQTQSLGDWLQAQAAQGRQA